LVFINKLKATKINFFLQFIGIRPYSTKSEDNSSIKPLVIYSNSLIEKDRILSENKDKSAIYR